MKVSEKTLELNVGAELLLRLRTNWGLSKAYLRGLTQREEKQEGVDFFVQLNTATRIFAFQFKAPRGPKDGMPYRFTLNKEQHNILFNLSKLGKSAVFYVFPFYVRPAKLQKDVPNLSQDTWVADVAKMPTGPLFGHRKTRTIKCEASKAVVNPEYPLQLLSQLERLATDGIAVRTFEEWRQGRREGSDLVKRRRNPWLVRGLRVAIAMPENAPSNSA